MGEIENIEEHIARVCECGSVNFNLLKSGKIECANCGDREGGIWLEKRVESRSLNDGLDALPIEKGEQSLTHKILYKMEIGDIAYLPNDRDAVYRRIYNAMKKTIFDYSWSPCINGGFVVRRDI